MGPRAVKSPFIAIIDDDEALCSSLVDLMRSVGYLAEPFTSAEMFLASCHLFELDCIIADVHMPAMTGVELYEHLIEAGHAIPTILVTGYPNAGVRERMLTLGVKCYLPKPLVEVVLIDCLRSAVARGRAPGA